MERLTDAEWNALRTLLIDTAIYYEMERNYLSSTKIHSIFHKLFPNPARKEKKLGVK